MPYDRVVFSFFRYPTSGALAALLRMGFQGRLRDRDEPADAIRLMGCGRADGFSVVPDFNRYCVMSALTRPQGLERVRQSGLYRRVARPSVEQIHLVLAPASGHGTWGGEVLFDYSGKRCGDSPFAVLTHSRVDPARVVPVWRDVPRMRRALAENPGCAYRMGFGEHPLLTLATLTVWQDLESMQRFAYGDTVHHRVSRAARAGDWLAESMFVRFEIEAVEGDLDRYPGLRVLATGAKTSATR